MAQTRFFEFTKLVGSDGRTDGEPRNYPSSSVEAETNISKGKHLYEDQVASVPPPKSDAMEKCTLNSGVVFLHLSYVRT